MKLSVIIVNYNVRAYLEQCLRAVVEAMKGIDGDVFVVDNQSTDGSVEMVQA
jgi:glycosyltransferase involved in cell wall biosynthesis